MEDLSRLYPLSTGKHFTNTCLASTNGTGNTQNLTFIEREGNIMNTTCVYMIALQNRHAFGCSNLRVTVFIILTGHQLNQLIRLRFFCCLHTDDFTFYHDRNSICNRQRIIDPMGDV